MNEIVKKQILVEEIEISKLKNLEDNPRKITKKSKKSLEASLKKLGDFGVIVVDENNVVLSGNQRVDILRKMGIGKVLIKKVVGYTEKEKKAIALIANTQAGDWDKEQLKDFITQDVVNFTAICGIDIKKILKQISIVSNYTQKTAIPVYEPQGINVKIKDLYDLSEFNEKLKLIEDLKDNKNLYNFLYFASTRFIKFNFKNIAEYYCNLQDEQVKKVFKDLALVIIDFQDAISRGFIELTEQLEMLERGDVTDDK